MTTNMNPFLHLEQEARRVAESMAEIRARCLSGLSGHPAGRAPAIDAWEATRNGPRGPLGFSPFYYFPFLFAAAFPSLPRETLRTLCLANRVLLEAVLLQDRQIDESRPWTPEDLYLVDGYHHRTLELLLPLFPPDHSFWTRTERCFTRYGRAVLREQFRHRHRLSPYGKPAFLAIAAGKVALIRMTLHAMADLSGQRRFLHHLLASQTLFLVGFQAFDDLKDWKQDLTNRNFTYLLTRVLTEGGFQDRVARDALPAMADVGTVLYFHGVASDQLLLAERLFEQALRLCGEAPVPLWREVIEGFSKNMRDMRNDFTEIRRRTGTPGLQAPAAGRQRSSAGAARPHRGHGRAQPARKDPPPAGPAPLQQGPAAAASHAPGPGEQIPEKILAGLAFLHESQAPCGGFRLLASACSYLSPVSGRFPSRGVTRLVLRTLGPLAGIHPGVPRLLCRAEERLAGLPGPRSASAGPPGYFEAAFRPGVEAPEGDLPADGTVPPPAPHRLNGLYWTDQIYLARRRDRCLSRLEGMALRCVRSSDYAPWYRTNPPGHRPTGGVRAACRPFLPLLLLLQSPGPDLFPAALLERVREYLLGRLSVTGGWTNATDTALHLLCLLASGHTGDERRSALERILRLQEPDGSWAPNAFYKQDGLYFGSRELTTAWCLLCLFLDAVATSLFHPRGRTHPGRTPAPQIRFVHHRGVPEALKEGAEAVLERYASLLPLPGRAQVFLGTWASMPAHFLLPHGETLLAGINLFRPLSPPFRSTAMRPYEVETVLGLFLAARVCRLGPLNDRLERLYVLGLALSACRRIWPEQPFHILAGISPLEESWCREHEPYLWSRIRDFLTCPASDNGRYAWLLPDARATRRQAIPAGAALYVGYSLFGDRATPGAATARESLAYLLDAGREAILQTFRSRAGLDPTLHTLLGRSLREPHTP